MKPNHPTRTPGFDAATPTGRPRPSREQYETMILETLDDDFSIGPPGEWMCPACKGSGDSGRTSRDEQNRPVPCDTCNGRGMLDHNPEGTKP